jgi:regulatory protein
MECLNYFNQLLSRREYSVYELTTKGKEKGFEEDDINAAISNLQSQGYQSDIRLIESAIASYAGKYGKTVIKRKCAEKGIDREVFEEVWQAQVDEGTEDDLGKLKAKVMRKYKITDFHRIDPKTKGKLWNYLQYRGFNPGEVIHQWQEEDAEE